jgi:L-fuconolactonase
VIIDAHLHVWDIGRAAYPWLGRPVEPIARSVTLEEAKPSLDRAEVDRVVLVQAADNSEDTANMLATADRCDRVAGVVGWVPLEVPDCRNPQPHP